MCIKKKHIGALKGYKTVAAEGVCQKVVAGIRCICFSCIGRRRTAHSAVPCGTGQTLSQRICHSEINIQCLFTKEITVQIKEAQRSGRPEERWGRKLFVQNQLEIFWLLFYTKPRGEGVKSSLISFHMAVPSCFSPVLKISVHMKMEFKSFGTQQADITMFEEKQHISVGAFCNSKVGLKNYKMLVLPQVHAYVCFIS